MKYTMVKQFWNASIDNIFSFFFKIVDFGKLSIEYFWAFFDIWAAFFGIFYNYFMYLYYLCLFMIDRGAESGSPNLRTLRKQQKVSRIPSVNFDRTPAVIPSMYKVKYAGGSAGKTISTTVENVSKSVDTVQKSLVSMKASSPGKGLKKSFFKSVGDFIVDYFVTVKNIITKPFKVIANFFAGKLMPVKEEDAKKAETAKRTGLIDQYMKEYEKQKRRF